MRIDPDPASGMLRLDAEGFASLVAGTGSPDVLASVLADERYAVALRLVQEADVTLDLAVAGRDVRLLHRGWLAGVDAAVLLLGVHADLLQLQLQDPAFLGAALVRLTRMRPRRVDDPRDPIPVDPGTVRSLTDEDTAARSAALALVDADLAWRLEVGAGEVRETLVAADGPRGIHVHDPDAGALLPTTNTAVYRVLSTLAPALVGQAPRSTSSVAGSAPSSSSDRAASWASPASSDRGTVRQ